MRGWHRNRGARSDDHITVQVERTQVLQGKGAVHVDLVHDIDRGRTSRKERAVGDIQYRKAQRSILVRAPARHIGARSGRRQQGTDGEIRTGDRSDYRASRDAGSGHIHANRETARGGGNDLRAGRTCSTITHVLYQRLVDTQKTLYPRINGRRAGGEVEATGVQIKGPRDIVAARELQHARPRLRNGRGIRQDTGNMKRDGRPRREGHAVKEVRVDLDGCGGATEVDQAAELGGRA